VTATLRNVMHGKMQPIPAFVTPACAEVIRKALSRHAKARITLDELAGNAWVRSKAWEFEQQLAADPAAGLHHRLRRDCHAHADNGAERFGTELHTGGSGMGQGAAGDQRGPSDAGLASCWRCCKMDH